MVSARQWPPEDRGADRRPAYKLPGAPIVASNQDNLEVNGEAGALQVQLVDKLFPPASGQIYDVAILVDVDRVRRRIRSQAWHGAHVTADRVDKSSPHRRTDLAHR